MRAIANAAVCATICGCPSNVRASLHTACRSSHAAGSFARAFVSAFATSALATVICIARRCGVLGAYFVVRLPGDRLAQQQLADRGDVGKRRCLADGELVPRDLTRHKSSTASFFGNALESAVSFTDAPLALCGGHRSATL